MPSDSLKSSRTDAGALDKRVVLLQPVYNASGDEISDWVAAATVWAAVEPVYAQEMTEAARMVETSLVTVTIRYRSDVNARWRILDHEHTYQIRGLVDPLRRRERLMLRCAEVL
jgi:SPP1 family predicted phage head-tail adaptor